MTDIFKAEGIQVTPPSQASSTQKATAPKASSGPVDIFQDAGVPPPSIDQKNVNALNSGIKLDSPQGEGQQQVANDVNQSRSDIEKLASTRFTPEQIQGFKDNPIGFWESFHLEVPFLSALESTAEMGSVLSIADRLKKGETITQAQKDIMDNFIDRQIEEQMRGRSIGGQIAYGLSEMPAFMVEFAASGGTYTAAKKAATTGIEKQAVKRVADVAVNVAARSAVFAPRVAEKYGERRVADSMTITDKGDLILKESQESPAKSALMAYGYTAADVASEMTGGLLAKYFIDPVAGVLKTPLISAVNELPAGLKNAMYEAYKKIKPSAQVSKVFTAAGWNGMIAELGEERVADVMKAFIGLAGNDQQAAEDGKNFTSKDFFDQITPKGDQLLVEAGIISIAGGVRTSADMAFNILKNKGFSPSDAQNTVDSLSASEQENFVNQALVQPKSTFVPAVEKPGDSTGFVAMGSGMAKAIGDNFVGGWYDTLSGGPNASSVFKTERMFTSSKEAFDRGEIKSPEDLRNFLQSTTSARLLDVAGSGFYRVPQNAETQAFASGTMKDSTYTDASAANQDTTIGLYDAATKKIEEKDPPPINHEESMSDKFIREIRNELWPIHKLGEMAKKDGLDVEGFTLKKFNPAELTSRMYSSVLTQTQWAINHGTFYYDKTTGKAVNTGKALKSILDDFDNYFAAQEPVAANRRKDFTDYLIAQRYMQDLSNREDVTVTEEQALKSISDLGKLQEKYGQDMEFFATFAKELYEYQKNVLYRLVVSGNMSQKKYDEIVKKNPNYVPFQRVIEKENLMRVTQGNPLFSDARSSAVIKSIHGSEADIKDPLTSIILNTARITDLALRNDAALQIANYAEIMPEYVQKTAPQMIKKGTAKVKVTYDKRLRERLLKAIEFFGNEFEHKKSLNEKGRKGFIRGDYNPMEKLVRLRLGSSDAVLAHEVGHMLDFSLGLDKKLLSDKKIKAELLELAEQRLSSTTTLKTESGSAAFEDKLTDKESDKHKEYVKNDREIVANFYDAYVNSPELLEKIAPTAKAAFEKVLDSRKDLAFIRDIKPSLERAEETVEQDLWGESPYAPQGSITAFRNGEREYYLVSKPILEAAKNLSPAQLNLFERIVVLPLSTVFRMGATLTPEFMLRSIPREGLTSIILNRDVKFNPKNYMRGFLSVVQNAVGSKTDLYKEFERSAKFSNYMELSENSIEKQFSEIISGKGRVMQYVKNPLKILEEVGMSIDQIARVGAYDAAKRAGFSDYEAALVSRDVFDYSRGGEVVKWANNYIPFLRAGVNGSDKLYRAFKERPVETAFWAFTTVTLPSVAIASYYLYFAPDDERKEYLEIPENLRSVFWFYKVDGEWIRVPKPFQIGYLFGTMPELGMLWMKDQNRPEGLAMATKVMAGIVESASPVSDWSSLLPIAAKIPTQWVANYNFFFGKEIYPSFLEGKDPALRKNAYTSETAIAIGKLFNASPALVDNALRDVFAGSAQYITGTGDFLINKTKEFNGETVPQKPITPSDVMIIRALAQRRPSGFRSNSYQTFSDRFDEVKQRKASLKDYDGKERKAYLEKNRGELSVYPMMNAAKKEISGLGKQLNAIYENKSMTSEEKVKRINAVEDRITDVARRANTAYNSALRGKEKQ